MWNPISKFRQSSIVFEKSRLFFWKIENFDELQLAEGSILFVESLHAFPTYQCLKKGVWDFSIFCLDYLQK